MISQHKPCVKSIEYKCKLLQHRDLHSLLPTRTSARGISVVGDQRPSQTLSQDAPCARTSRHPSEVALTSNTVNNHMQTFQPLPESVVITGHIQYTASLARKKTNFSFSKPCTLTTRQLWHTFSIALKQFWRCIKWWPVSTLHSLLNGSQQIICNVRFSDCSGFSKLPFQTPMANTGPRGYPTRVVHGLTTEPAFHYPIPLKSSKCKLRMQSLPVFRRKLKTRLFWHSYPDIVTAP